ncbi:hypothetical protein C8A01DRAFT_14359, partial [Parachaetomium inaequale]
RLHEILFLAHVQGESRQGHRSPTICAGITRHADLNRAQEPRSLMSFSSAWSTASATSSSYAPSWEMDAGELMLDCTFPELLVRDLATSEDSFTSKAMTAGSPCAGLAAPGVGASPSFQRPLLPYRESHRRQPPPDRDTPLLPSFVTEEASSCVDELDDDRQLGIKKERPGSSNVTSIIGMVPHSVRTRQQSVATAATSDSGRCSSLFSHNTLPPTSPVISPCSSKGERSPHGTWFEDEPDSPQDGPGSSVFTARTSISDPHQPVLDLSNDDEMAEPRKPTTGRTGFTPAAAEAFFPGGGYGTHSRPHTPASQRHLEKPRIVDIPPVAMGPKRTSSLKWSSYGADSASIASEPGAVPVRMVERHRQAGLWDMPKEPQPQHGVPILETANGRTVIDASAPPPIAFASRDQALHHARARPLSPVAVDESEIVDSGEEAGTRAYAEALTEARKPSLADLRRWVDASAETLNSSHKSAAYTPSVPSPGIPLPPEVVESLRVSISCFPETMLLTSSLSIETIRAYSKKVKHRAGLNRNFRSTDSDSIYSSSSYTPKPSRRWNMSWLGHPRCSSEHHQQPQPQQRQQHCYTIPRGTHPPPLAVMSPSNLSLTTAATPPPTTPTSWCMWSPIKNIFPSASDHLCDALYAHLLAYNYIASLSPLPSTPSPLLSTPSSSSSFREAGSRAKTSGEDSATRNLQIPQKAASLLGMGVGMDGHQLQQQQLLPPRRRGVLSRNSGGGGGGGGLFPRSGTSNGFPLRSGTSNGFPRSGTSHGFGGSGGNQEAVMKELRAGLGRCVNLLVATMRKDGVGPLVDEEGGSLFGSEFGGGAEGVEVVEPVLMRALCEVVRCTEEGRLGVL